MTVQSYEAIGRTPDPESQLAAIRALIDNNREEFARVMRLTGGEAGAADAKTLCTLLAAPQPEPADIADLLSLLRNILADTESDVARDALDARSDLDAAINWWGARLDGLLRG